MFKNFTRQWLSKVFAALLLTLIISLFSTTIVRAESGNGGQQTLRNSNNFYAYVGSGENIDVEFEKLQIDTVGSKYDVTITVSRPNGTDVVCSILTTDPVGQKCTFSNLTASSAGIWRIKFEVPAQTFSYHSWLINVQNGSTDISGRVWSEAYYISQAIGGQSATSPDLKYWFKSEIGYLYEVDYRQYFGIDSLFQASSFGIVKKDTCNSVYKSVAVSGSLGSGIDVNEANQNCGGLYKLFFDQPANDLPQSAPKWDGSIDWINTNVANPAVSDLKFEPESQASLKGTFSFKTTNYVGVADVDVDVNNNGSFNDNVDRSFSVGAPLGREVSIYFNGLDGNGGQLDNTQKLNFRVKLGRVGEIHFVNTDAEKRAGGIRVQRHTGSTDGRFTLYWDDRDFSSTVNQRCSSTPALSAINGVNSSAGVHGWGISGCANLGNDNKPEESNTGSWGDSRHIHDWTYAPSPIITAQYSYLPDVYVECETEVGKSCTTNIPEFCTADLLSNPQNGTSSVENGTVTFTPEGNVADEQNYVHLRESESQTAKCFVKIRFIPTTPDGGISSPRKNKIVIGSVSAVAISGLLYKANFRKFRFLKAVFKK